MNTYNKIRKEAERRLKNLKRKLKLGEDFLSIDEVMDIDEEIDLLEEMLNV